MNIVTLADRSQSRFGNYEALVDAERTWTSHDLRDRASRLAGSLVRCGVAPGDRLVILLPNGSDSVVAFTAALRCGGVPVPLFIGSSLSDIEEVIRDCTPSAIVTTAQVVERAGRPFEHVPVKVMAPLDAKYAPEWLGLDELAHRGEPLAPPTIRQPSDPALICYTSGTSGAPKGVVYTHGGLHASHGGPARHGNGTVLMALPLNTFGGWALTGRMVFRWKLILLPRFEPRAFLSAIERYRVTRCPLVPSMGEALASLPDAKQFDLSSLRRVTLTGAHASPALIERLTGTLGIAPTVGYGMTEAGGRISGTSPTSKPGSVGRVAIGVEVKVVSDEGTTLLNGEAGEIWVKTPWMAAGYVGQRVEGAAVFDDGWLRTGDLGYLDADKDLFILGRRKDIIIQGGLNVSPAEVTDVISRHPAVRECVVVGLPHQFLGEELVACLVADDPSLTEANVIDHCTAHMDARKVPVRAHLWEALPHTAVGKIDSREIRKRLQADGRQVVETAMCERLRASEPTLQRALVRDLIQTELRRVLPADGSMAGQRGVLDPATPFGNLGLDSLRAARFAHGLSDALGWTLSPVLAFSHPTIDALTAQIVERLIIGERAIVPSATVEGLPPARDAVAIVGFGCRLPKGVDTPAQFWAMLRDGLDATGEITRWNLDGWYDSTPGTPGKMYTRRAALLDTAHLFDAEFFGLSESEALALDPQHRLALEVTWEAIEHAGYNALGLANAGAGLFLGISGPADPRSGGLGAVPSMAVGRICNFLDLRGPALAIDTSCSSSLAAIHAAVQSLRGRECDFAIAGGVHVIGSPASFVHLSEMGVLARDGRCKAFDANADGYGRGEGCVMIALKRLSEANADRCRIIAVIRGSATRHDGRSASLTAPNGRAQQEVIRAALSDAANAPEDIDYLEAHGTGTSLGDPIELEAAMAVLRHPGHTLLLGSVKTNIGHLEAAAGAAGVAKVALALQHEAIPPHLHYHSLNPLLASLATSFQVPVALTPWPRTAEKRRLAGVTSMGLSGTNVHVVLEEAPSLAATAMAAAADGSVESDAAAPHLLCLSARGPAALRDQARRYSDHFATVTSEGFADQCFTASVGRAHFRYRLGMVVQSREMARQRLLAFSKSEPPDAAWATDGTPRIAFLFTGQGRQHQGMGRGLYESEPTFRDAIDRCAEILLPMIQVRLVDALYARGPDVSTVLIDSMAVAQPAIFALEWALAALWGSWGIKPAAMLGHSIGECVAACLAGVMTLEDGLMLAAARGRLLESLPASGAMAAFLTDEDCVRRAIAGREREISVAAINGPQNVVVAGSAHAVAAVEQALASDGVETRHLHIPRAAHSPAVEPILDDLELVASTIVFSPSHLPLVSTVTGQFTSSSELSHAAYWRRHMRSPVRFSSAISTLLADGCTFFIEIGPGPVLTTLGQDCVTDPHVPRSWLPSLRHDRDDREQMYESLAELYMRGVDPDWDRFYRHTSARRVALPTYPFQRQAYSRGVSAARLPPQPTHVTKERPIGVARNVDRPPRPSNVASVRGLRLEPAEKRPHTIAGYLRQHLVEIAGRDAAGWRDDTNLLRLGFDSVRVIDLVTKLGRQLGVACRPVDFIRQPTIAGFAQYLTTLIEPASGGREVARSSSPLVTINASGTRPPLCCMHPSGGQVTAYLRFRELVGDDQPLYGIQSRALDNPTREHPSLESMAIDYATIIQSLPHREPYRVLGWSMGGAIAHAVAEELERRGAVVEMVGLIDPIVLRAEKPSDDPLHDAAFAVTAAIHDAHREPPTLNALYCAIADSTSDGDPRATLLSWCKQRDLIPAGTLTLDQFNASLDLYLRHFKLMRQHQPRVVAAPVHIWWAAASARALDPTSLGRGGIVVKSVGGTHFSIMRPPYIEAIAADLAVASSDASARVPL